MADPESRAQPETSPPVRLPRVTIQFCTQCKWMLRAAYFAQELISTFSTALGEVALQPTTGGIFTVAVSLPADNLPPTTASATTATHTHTLWDRKVDGGFPETKELKRRLRDVIEPGRNLGHVDRDYGPAKGKDAGVVPAGDGAGGVSDQSRDEGKEEGEKCEDCVP